MLSCLLKFVYNFSDMARTYKKKPSVRQRKTAAIMVASGGKIADGKAMTEAGFSEAYAKNPKKLLTQKSFIELLDEYMPDDYVAMTQSELAKAAKHAHRTFPTSMTDKEITEIIESIAGCKVIKIHHGEQANHCYYWEPDGSVRHSALDMRHKIKGQYTAEKINPQNPIKALTDDELDAQLRQIEEEKTKRLSSK